MLKRYQQLSSAVERLVVFGEVDQPVALDATFIDVTGCALLVVLAPNYAALLAARDLETGFPKVAPFRSGGILGVTLTERTFVEAASRRLEQYASVALGDSG